MLAYLGKEKPKGMKPITKMQRNTLLCRSRLTLPPHRCSQTVCRAPWCPVCPSPCHILFPIPHPQPPPHGQSPHLHQPAGILHLENILGFDDECTVNVQGVLVMDDSGPSYIPSTGSQCQFPVIDNATKV